MKKIRISLYAIALLLAIGSAFASSKSPIIQGYKIGTLTCVESVDCNNEGSTCMDGSSTVYDGVNPNFPTDCGAILKHRP